MTEATFLVHGIGFSESSCHPRMPTPVGNTVMTLRKRILWVALCAFAGAFGFAACVALANARMLARRYPVVPVELAAATSPGAVAHGKALADIAGCTDCHRADLRGGLFDDEGWWNGKYYASNLTLKARSYSDADLARVVRLGVRPDGRGVIAMPSFAFVRLTDSEMADLIAFVRSVPAGGPEQPGNFIGPFGQWDLWRGRTFKTAISYVAAERVKEPADAGPEYAAARHLVGIVCAECHGGALTGNGWDSGAPDLVVGVAYGVPELTRLLRTGIGLDGREHGLMSDVARSRLHNLTDAQIVAIRDYLGARARLKP